MLIRFYGDLNRHLYSHCRGSDVEVNIPGNCTVLSLLEYFGVPASEVDLLLVNAEAAGFEDVLQARDRVSIYPCFRSLDIAPLGLINRGSLH
ncbi:MAG: hypothetical protein MI673_10460 [Thiotrichales bacterium]|nr:hypothetical protein [Thiotrichales bacterium]